MWAFITLIPQQASAYDFRNHYGVYNTSVPNNTINPVTKRVCAINDTVADVPPSYQNRKRFGFTKRIVLCVKESILAAVNSFLVPFSNVFGKTIAAMCTLAILVWGFQVAAGKRSAPTREAFLLGIKMGLVIMFTSNFAASYFDPGNVHGGLFGLLLDAMEDLLGVVISYARIASSLSDTCYPLMPGNAPLPGSPLAVMGIWDTIDCALDSLVGGIFSPLTLSAGVVGFLIAALVSNVVGLFIALLGFMLIGMLLIAIAKAVYIFITAYIAFALMILVSPMIIPLVLFTSTKAYFEKWLKLTIGFVLQPIFIFAYLSMLMAAYDTLVYTGQKSLYRSIVGNYIDDPNFVSLNSWVRNNGGFITKKHAETAVNLSAKDIVPVCTQTACEINNTISKHDTGVLGTIGKEFVNNATAWQNDIYSVLGNDNIFRTSVPVTIVDWEKLAVKAAQYDAGNPGTPRPEPQAAYDAYRFCKLNPTVGTCPGTPDPQNFLKKFFYPYLIGVLTSAVMAVITVFIFMQMLEYLPFIGAGISGESLSMPTFGTGNLAMPGSKMMGNLKNKLASQLLGRPSS